MGHAPAAPAWSRLLALLGALLSVLAYRGAGERFYAGFAVPQGYGMTHLVPQELAHLSLFGLLGFVAMAGFAWALRGLPLLERAGDLAARVHLPGLALAGAGLLGLLAAAVSSAVLGHQVVTDDEHAYRFIAQTLRQGGLVAPSPGDERPFFVEQFVVLTDQARYGKYPIGHPLLLAAGQSVGAEPFVVPLLTALLVPALAWIGRRAWGDETARLGLLFLVGSPMIVLTGATLLSQPAAALCLLLMVGALLEAEASGRRAWLAAAGLAAGYGVLVRPLPTVLFAGAAGACLAWRRRAAGPGRLLGELSLFGLPAGLGSLAFLWVNQVQSGALFRTGYQAFHAPDLESPSVTLGMSADATLIGMSLVAALLRTNAWLLGWPLSLLPLAWARPAGRAALAWACVAMAVVYRVLSPKAGVGTTGPIYMLEAAPLLCLLAAEGLLRATRDASRRGWRGAIVAAGLLVSATFFLPVKLADLKRAGDAQRLPTLMLKQAGVERALVFHRDVVPYWTGLSWAYGPPTNPPDLEEADIVWVRLQPEPLEANFEFWRRRFPDRPAFHFGYVDGRPTLRSLDALRAPGAAGGAGPPVSPSS